MDSTNYLLFNNCLDMTTNESELPLLDNNILNEINNESNFFEVDNFLSSVSSSNDSDTLPELMSISQNCSFDSISIHNLTNQSNEQLNYDQYNSSASSSTSEIYSPIQITPPETPPSCETASQFSINSGKIKKTTTNRTIKKSKNEQNLNKKKKLLPLAPKTEAVTFVKVINQQQEQLIDLKTLYNNNNTLNYNLNNQNVIINKMPIKQTDNLNNQQIINQQSDEKLSKEELSKLKEQARKLRNRQSAMASRQKKQDYVKSIEKKLEDLNNENQNLKKENIKLKEIINKLQFENNQFKNLKDNKLIVNDDYYKYGLDDEKLSFKQNLFTTTDAKKAKKTICLLAVVFLIGLNMNLYNDNFKTYDSRTKVLSNSKSNNLFKGRVLLWTDDLENNNLNNTFNNTINCQNLISQNETLILESKLRNWAIHQTNKQHNYLLNSNFDSNTNKLNDKLDGGNRLPWYFNRNWNQIDENKIDRLKQKQIYNDELNYLINSVKPKDDTYYFLSLNPTDHLILPLNFYSNNSNNGKLRPKFSLLLPAITTNSQFTAANSTKTGNSLNQTNNSNSILQLIEIDFEVVNMKPIQILKNRLHLNNNARIRRSVLNYESAQLKQTNQSKLNSKPLVKSILTRNQTNIVQSQIISNNLKNRTIGVN